ncbi:MAG TPA: hypothetical protein DCO75_05865 [Fibrobacteres bacterium]|nr:hypothetical protein [Fibrobacterota bacterium]
MKHFASQQFWKHYYSLPQKIQESADRCFALLKFNHRHPSLHLKNTGHFWSVRIGIHWRALAVESDNTLIWFWIGNHSEYDRIINSGK